MKTTHVILIGAALVAGACRSAADPSGVTVAQLYDSQIKGVEGEIVSLAEAMPEAAFDFKPANGEFAKVRTFAEQVKHVAAVNYMVSAAALGEKPGRDLGKGENGPDDVKGKSAIVQFLKDSYAYAHKAALSLTAANQLDMIQSPFGSSKVARGNMSSIVPAHSFDHYGQMVVYARMNGVVPPASR